MKAVSKADLRRAIIAAEAAQANHPAKALPTATQRQRLDRSRRGSEELASTFLREAGAPLDNNICERALKRAVLHRKNALFYRTLHGAEVGDLFMTLIHTCQLCGANSFDYLTELQRHAQELASNPVVWMPWNYRQTLERAGI